MREEGVGRRGRCFFMQEETTAIGPNPGRELAKGT